MFQLRQQVRQRLVETLALTRPAAPLVAAQGTPGATTIGYAIVATNTSGHSEVSQTTTITNAAATLTGVNFNQINWQLVPNASGYDVYRVSTNGVSPVTLGKIGSTTAALTLNDTGLAGDAATAPTTNTSGINSPFWTEDELHQHVVNGAKDMWKAIVDLHQGHFVRILDATNYLTYGYSAPPVYPAGASQTITTFTGIPVDCFRIINIEPQDLGNAALGTSARYFKPKQINSDKFQQARAMTVTDASTFLVIYYDILNAGSPVGAPTLVGAPPVGSAIPLRLMFVYTLPTLTDTDNNPIPGESDNALIAWAVAYAKAKEQDTVNRVPDPGWLAIYNTEKQGLLVALTPRQEQEEEVVEGLFDGQMEDW
jgi:hypothetical protein